MHTFQSAFGFARDVIGREAGGGELVERSFVFLVQQMIVETQKFVARHIVENS
jgi:hypothetical protein